MRFIVGFLKFAKLLILILSMGQVGFSGNVTLQISAWGEILPAESFEQLKSGDSSKAMTFEIQVSDCEGNNSSEWLNVGPFDSFDLTNYNSTQGSENCGKSEKHLALTY